MSDPTCDNCGELWRLHCAKHVIPCCPHYPQHEPAAAPAEGPPHRDTRVPPDLSEDRDGEHCYDCGKAVGLVWTAPDAMWAKVTDRADGGGLLCVLCFDRRAEQRGRPLRWVPQPLAAPAEGLREALAALVEATTHLGQYREVGQLDFCESSPHEGYCGAAMHALGRARAALARHESGSE